jgi:hypothetical protein
VIGSITIKMNYLMKNQILSIMLGICMVKIAMMMKIIVMMIIKMQGKRLKIILEGYYSQKFHRGQLMSETNL